MNNKTETQQILERLELVKERIHEIPREKPAAERFFDYFQKAAAFIEITMQAQEAVQTHAIGSWSLEKHRQLNRMLYEELLPGNYEQSYADPAYAVQQLGKEYGSMLSMLYAELRALIAYAYEGNLENYTILCELFVQVYARFADPEGTNEREIRQIIYWFFHDYSEIFTEDSICGMIDPGRDFFTKIIMESDLSDLRYLYLYGEPIGENELQLADYFNRMPQADIQSMADTFTEGYRIGFEVTGKDLSIKSTVNVHYAVGMERMVRAAIENFAKMGLKTTVFRSPVSSFQNRSGRQQGCYSTSVNKQYDYDHKDDRALYFDKAFVERKLETIRTTYEANRTLASDYAGPAVIEVFGEKPFEPVNKPEALHYTEKQNRLNVYHASEAGQITNRYIKGEERSFTIIAYPVPEIGEQFEEIFHKTVEINTLDYTQYRDMQQKIIDVLDQGVRAHIKGKGANETDLYVSFCPLENPGKQTVFENCVADVNIPVGEVFTSPVLKGTTGLLHVSSVYLNGLRYEDLRVHFSDGMVADYSCGNFAAEEENRAYFYENVLMRHDTLPMGEFAIGTNTTAYRMAKDYGIADKLPILIAEKTGPHFAVGDTCYSHAEDTAVYNADGKEIIARDNEISVLRKEDVSKAYFNCHTDITIPFEELDFIAVERSDGSQIDIIRDGKFVVSGTEELNRPLE